MTTYYCNEDEDFVVGIYSVDREPEAIAKFLSKNLDMDLIECDPGEYDEFASSDFSHDTVILRWKQLSGYADSLDFLESKNINLYVVF